MKRLITVWALLFTSNLYAADIEQQLQQCRAIEAQLQRLVCYDKIETTATDDATPSGKAVEPNFAPVADFGLERKKVEQQTKALDTLSLKLKTVTTNKLGLMVFTFSNGQVWRQATKEYFAVKGDGDFQIERGMLGAFYLSKAGENRRIRVVREQ